MAMTRGVRAFSILLLCCWPGAELQLINVTSDSTAEDSHSFKNQDMPGVFDEILVQQLLEPNKSSVPETAETLTTASTWQSKGKISGIDENYQSDGSENYHELLENLDLSSHNEDKVKNDEKNSKSDSYDKMSVLDKILKNIGKSEGELKETALQDQKEEVDAKEQTTEQPTEQPTEEADNSFL